MNTFVLTLVYNIKKHTEDLFSPFLLWIFPLKYWKHRDIWVAQMLNQLSQPGAPKNSFKKEKERSLMNYKKTQTDN